MTSHGVEYELKTEHGRFIFKVELTLNRDTTIPVSYNINIGSKNNYCIQIRVPSKESGESGETDAYLMWVEAGEKCSLETYIETGLAKHMTLIGFTLTRQINTNIKTISFEDTSSFKCDLPDNKKIKVPMKAFYIAFHEATWYESNFGAKLKTNYKEYCKLKKNMYKSENKPKRFNFVNKELQEELEPLYNSTLNWSEFFQAISKKYGKKKCGIVYPWIMNALYEVFGSNIFDDTRWYIDFKDHKEQNTYPMLTYNIKKIEKTTGGYKKIKQRRFTFSRTHIFPNIPEIQKWNYMKFIN